MTSPALAHVLLNPEGSALKPLQAALLHLAMLGCLQTSREQSRVLFFTRNEVRIRRAESPVPLPPELSVILEALFPNTEHKPLSPTAVVHALQRRFGHDYRKYISDYLWPGLIQRGWLAVEEYRIMSVVRRQRPRVTAEGERTRAALEEQLRAVSEVPQLLATDSRRALRTVTVAGPLVVMSEALRPQMASLAEAARAEIGNLDGDLTLLAELDEDERKMAWADALEMLGSIDWDGILGAFDGFGDGGGDGGDGGGGE